MLTGQLLSLLCVYYRNTILRHAVHPTVKWLKNKRQRWCFIALLPFKQCMYLMTEQHYFRCFWWLHEAVKAVTFHLLESPSDMRWFYSYTPCLDGKCKCFSNNCMCVFMLCCNSYEVGAGALTVHLVVCLQFWMGCCTFPLMHECTLDSETESWASGHSKPVFSIFRSLFFRSLTPVLKQKQVKHPKKVFLHLFLIFSHFSITTNHEWWVTVPCNSVRLL